MLSDLRTAAAVTIKAEEITSNKSSQTKRFWARLMIELGKNFPQPVDLMTATPQNAQLNIIQASLLQRRLLGDVIGYANRQAQQGFPNSRPVADLLKPRSSEVRFLNTSYERPLFGPHECTPNDEEGLVMDGRANVVTRSSARYWTGSLRKAAGCKRLGSGSGLRTRS
jgi:hypothetical protein